MYKEIEFKHVKGKHKKETTKSGKYIVSTLGYQPTREKIISMTMAGINQALVTAKIKPEELDMELSPEKSREFDLVDAGKIMREEAKKLANYKARIDTEQRKRIEERQKYLEETAKKYEEIQKSKKPEE